MKTPSFALFSLVLALALALFGTAFAQAPQGGIVDPSGSGVIQDFKTPPLADTDTFVIPIDVHVPAGTPAVLNWAGVRMKTHILDAGEVDIDGITFLGVPVPGPAGFIADPFGPRSNNVQSVPMTFTVLDPNWPGSGITLLPSQNVPVFDIALHAKNTTPLNNSDIDLTLMFSNIYHLGPQPSSQVFDIPQSWHIFVSSNIFDIQQLHITTPAFASQFRLPEPAALTTGHWLHLTQTLPFHVFGTPGGGPNPGSNLIASPGGGTAFIGIEHIPEPSRAILLGLGLGAMIFGVRARRRRQGEDAA